MFRNEYQYHQHQKMAANLPQDQAILYADFSQNYALASNDEIINVHYVTKQVTVHTMYLIRHAANSTPKNPTLTREAIIMISDELKHSVSIVYSFTLKLLAYMREIQKRKDSQQSYIE